MHLFCRTPKQPSMKKLTIAVVVVMMIAGGVVFLLVSKTPESTHETFVSAGKPLALNEAPEQMEKEAPGIDVLDQALFVNGKDMPKPPKKFKTGHVSQRKLEKYLKKTKLGFEIKLPTNTNVPTPIVHRGKLYLSGGFGSKQYYAFDAKTGDFLWGVDLDDDGPSSAAIEDDIMVFNTESCTIFAVDIKTGEHLWSYWLGDPLMSMPTIANGKVFTAYPTGGKYYQEMPYNKLMETLDDSILHVPPTHVMVAFDLHSGNILWQQWIDGDIMTAPVVEDGELYATTLPGTVYKFDMEDGAILTARSARATSAPVFVNGDMVFSKRSDQEGEEASEVIVTTSKTMNQNKLRYNEKKADYLNKKVQEQTSFKQEAADMDAGNGFMGGAPATAQAERSADNVGYANVSSLQSYQGSRTLHSMDKNYNTMGDELVCNDARTGEEFWRIPLDGDLKKAGGFLGTPPISVGNYIIIATHSGEVKILHATSGKEVRSYNVGEPIRYQPIAVEGWIYVTTTRGKLVAIDTKDSQVDGWPMWGGNPARTNTTL